MSENNENIDVLTEISGAAQLNARPPMVKSFKNYNWFR